MKFSLLSWILSMHIVSFQCQINDAQPTTKPFTASSPPSPMKPTPYKFDKPSLLTPSVFTTPSAPSVVTKPVSSGQDFVDTQLLHTAKPLLEVGLGSGLQETINTFQAKPSTQNREALQIGIMTALAGAANQLIVNLTDAKNPNVIPTLKAWNDAGVTKRDSVCQQIKQKNSLVPTNVIDCMCNSKDPYVKCMALLGTAAYQYQATKQRERSRGRHLMHGHDGTNESKTDNVMERSKNLRQRQTTTQRRAEGCELNTVPEFLFGQNKAPSLKEILEVLSDKPSGIEIEGECCFPLNPPPLTLFNLCGYVELAVEDWNWLDPAVATLEISSGNITKGGDIIKQLASEGVSVGLKVCFIAEKLVKDFPGFKDLMDFLGIDLCVATLSFNDWPARAHSEISLKLSLAMFYFDIALDWQVDTILRDIVGLCDGEEQTCSSENLFCKMEAGDVLGYVSTGIDFLLWNPNVYLELGATHPYADCHHNYPDGTTCLLGTSCKNCENPATWWWGPAITKCGKEPKYPDGTTCLVGTSCNSCQNPAKYWWGPAITKCGNEPKYPDGTTCLLGSSCNVCQNNATWWWGPAISKCGNEPKYPDGTTCLLGTSCNSCKNPATYWWGPAITKCGLEPKYPDGTTCLVGTSCKSCKNPATWWYGPAITKCGNEPKYPDGTICLVGTSCNNCKNPATWWYGKAAGFTACGKEPKYPDGTVCVPFYSCNNCLHPAHWFTCG